jgi:hypothetical protein
MVTDATNATMGPLIWLVVLTCNAGMLPMSLVLLTCLKRECHRSLAVLSINLRGSSMPSLSSDPMKQI